MAFEAMQKKLTQALLYPEYFTEEEHAQFKIEREKRQIRKLEAQLDYICERRDKSEQEKRKTDPNYKLEDDPEQKDNLIPETPEYKAWKLWFYGPCSDSDSD